jgi:beta-galactosidase/beta-glucuronidase
VTPVPSPARESVPGDGWPTDHPEYPRMQCQRRDWLNLNGEWRFHYDDTGLATHPRHVVDWDRSITVPFAPESELSGIGDTGFHTDVWYQRDFDLETVDRTGVGGPVIAHFGAVDYLARVWVNDVFVGEHEGGFSSFSLDITDALVPGATQVIAVWAHDDPHDLAQPRGKQDWRLEPHSIWYPRTTGIWQTVWIEELPPVHIARLAWTPELLHWEIGVGAIVRGASTRTDDEAPLDLRVRLSCSGRTVSDDRYRVVDGEVHRIIGLSDPGIDDYRNELLWSPESPALIDALVELRAGDAVLDTVRSYTALRGVDLHRGRFLLNNRPYRLRLVLDQGYWPGSLMTPPSEEAIIRDIRLVKQAGFNGVRKHQKIEDPRFHYWADRLGLLVWQEMPSAYRFTHESVRRITREWTEIVDRDANHPCIIVWVPFNESWGVPNLPGDAAHRSYVEALYHLTHTLDPSRPVIGNDGWESGATDIVGIHDYDDEPERMLARYDARDEGDASTPDLNGWPGGRVLTLEDHPHRGQPVMLTEFGGIAQRDARDPDEAHVWGYSVATDGDDVAKRYAALLDAVNRIESFSGFCYTQFTDTFQEANGLFFEDRTPKFDLERMRRATVRAPDIPSQVTAAPETSTATDQQEPQ